MATKRLLVWCAVFSVLGTGVASGQKPSHPTTRLGVDVVSLRNGPQLFGAITQRNEQGLTLAVERSWLKKTHARYYNEHVAVEKAEAIVAAKRLKERIDLWIESRAGDENLVLFLRSELERLKMAWQASRENPPALSQFVVIDVDASQIRNVYAQPAERKQVALIAWKERLDRVTTRTTSNLANELTELGVTAPKNPIDLSDRLPTTQLQTDKEWAAKVAVVEYRMRKKVGFQGTGDYLARTGDGAKEVNMAEMMQVVLKQQMEQQLQNLLNPNAPKVDSQAWLGKAIKEAEQLEVSGFRVSRLDKNMIGKTVTVVSSFVARLPDDTWKVVWENSQQRDLSAVQNDQKDQVAEAPRIQEMLALLKGAGIVNADQQVQEALAYGAVTKAALDDANEAFLDYVSKYGSRVDTPRIQVP